MPILFTAVLSVGLAWLRGVPPTELGTIRLRWLPLPLVAFAIQLLVFVRLERVFGAAAFPLHILSLSLLLVFLASNVRYRSLVAVGFGLLLNLAVIAANGGYMPVRIADMERAGFYKVAEKLGREGHYQKSTVLDAETPLWFLADVLHVPLPNGPDRLISVGDIFVAAGTFLFIQEALVARRRIAFTPTANAKSVASSSASP